MDTISSHLWQPKHTVAVKAFQRPCSHRQHECLELIPVSIHTRFIPVSPCQVRVIVLMECHSLNANIQCDLVWFITLWWMHKVCVCQTGRKETAAGVIVYCHAAYFSYFFPSLLPPSQPLFSTSFFRLSLFPVSYAAKNIVCVFCSRMGCWPSPVIFILVCYWGTRRAKVAVCSAYVFTFSVIHNHCLLCCCFFPLSVCPHPIKGISYFMHEVVKQARDKHLHRREAFHVDKTSTSICLCCRVIISPAVFPVAMTGLFVVIIQGHWPTCRSCLCECAWYVFFPVR